MESKKNVIVCPHCGWEYLPEEIFVKGELEGHPSNIIRDPLGKILYNEGEEPEYIEHYNCDGCGRDFIIEALVSFKSRTEDEEKDFTNQYVNLLDE